MENLKAFGINLQLFAGEEDDFTNDELNVVDSTTEVEEEFDVEESIHELDNLSNESVNNDEVAEHQEEGQSKEENAQFRKMRLKAEEEVKKKYQHLETERIELETLKREIEEKKSEQRIRDEYLSTEKVWQKADQEGVSESVARKLLEMEANTLIDAEKRKVRERFEVVEAQKKTLQKDEFYNEVAPRMEQILQQRPDLDPNTVYYHLKGQMADELYRKALVKTEKRTIANVHDSMKRRTVPSSGAGESANDITILSEKGKEMAIRLGVDPRLVAKHVKENLKK